MALGALAFAVLLAPPPAMAQPAAPATRGVDLEASLVGFPVSVGPDDSLAVALEVVNSGAAEARDLEVTLTVYQGVTSRSRLEQTYDGRLGTTLAVDTIRVEGSIEPGGTRRIEVAKPLAELGTFRNSTLDRTYPVRVVVRSGETAANTINTHMVFFHEPPEIPLGLGLVIPLHSESIYTNGGRPALVTDDSLERSITGGRLSRIISALEQHPDLPVTLAPSGLLLSMLHDMSDGYPRSDSNGTVSVPASDPRAEAAAQALERLRALAGRPNTRIIATTYSPVSLPALNRFGLQDLGATQIAEGRNVLRAEPVGLLRAEPLEGWIMPTFGIVDQPTLTQLHRTPFTQLILSPGSLRPSDSQFTRALPVRLEGGAGSATGGLTGVETVALVADSGLARQIEFSGEESTIEARQRFVAETATLHLETPGLRRASVAVAPADWEAAGDAAANLLEVIGSAPWLAATTPDAIVQDFDSSNAEEVRLASSESVLAGFSRLPAEGYFSALADARQAIARYTALSPPPERIGALVRRLLIAESTDWWTSSRRLAQGRSFAEAIPPAITSEVRKVHAPPAQTITLTSRTGVIPLSVGSGLAYPVDVVVRLDSDKLRFPDGNTINIEDLSPPNHTIQVRAITQSSGTFPLNIQIFTPGGTLISESQLTIRSTAYNVVALWITGAAGVFIVAWWIAGLLRRRLKSAEEEEAGAEVEEEAGNPPSQDLAPGAREPDDG